MYARIKIGNKKPRDPRVTKHTLKAQWDKKGWCELEKQVKVKWLVRIII